VAEKQASDLFVSAVRYYIKIQGNTLPVNQQTMLPDMIQKMGTS
jgi:twitching motility protein PilU